MTAWSGGTMMEMGNAGEQSSNRLTTHVKAPLLITHNSVEAMKLLLNSKGSINVHSHFQEIYGHYTPNNRECIMSINIMKMNAFPGVILGYNLNL